MATIESVLEAKFSLRAAASADIAWFTTQPLRIRAYLNGLARGYTPDAAAQLASGAIGLVEVKYFNDLSNADVLTRLTAVRRDLATRGFGFWWATERELDRPDENLLIRLIKSYSAVYTLRERVAFDARLRNQRTLTLGEAADRLGSRAAALHLVAHRILWLDYRQPLSNQIVLSRDPAEANHVVKLFSDW